MGKGDPHTHTPTPHPVLDNAGGGGLVIHRTGLWLDRTWAVSYLEQPDGLCKTPVSMDVDFPMKSDWDRHPGRTHGATILWLHGSFLIPKIERYCVFKNVRPGKLRPSTSLSCSKKAELAGTSSEIGKQAWSAVSRK